MPYTPPPELASLSLAQIAEQVAARKLPPVAEWAPTHEGDSHMRIDAAGTWYHDGSAITRPAMVRAFSGLLRREEDGSHSLVTPYQKLAIAVEDAPLVAVDVQRRDGALAFRLNTDDLVVAGPDHALAARGDADTPAIYLHVRSGLEARLNRSTYEQLAALSLEEGDDWTVTSGGETFSLQPA
ncbi:DUF1285 domain-containing protein [Alteriqipengyuania flavescens]|uniref:DUF1285 domain-containing protein n=1 Tax=Alteriqipengyuania flavescens TaxID=3053610 RepID=UPI0025B51228|nr:DUF1285 domain-containing protein [Alteriqipengyuania flavescens]WJY18777.1 DUF1285 domain-containing protein [Alteriqipengyuania flavescens]WJY24717.1 DUF1285 domain-containing protein [Alteriqipengyuania flavescens]